jgi:probable HAF family extracellular repeat protein
MYGSRGGEMNQRVGLVKNNKAVAWMALWAVAVLLSAVALFISFGTKQASAADPTSYTVTNLGHLGGGSSNANDVNDKGQVVGQSYTSNNEGRAFLYKNGQMINLGTLGGAYSAAYGINNNGQIVGVSYTSNNEQHAFLWQNGQMKDLGGIDSYALDINNSGQVVGFAYTQQQGQAYAYLYENGQMKNLGTLGGANSVAYGINDNGQVVGYSDTTDHPSGDQHAFLWENDQMRDLGTFGVYNEDGNTHSTAEAINNNGQAVGSSMTSSAEQHAALYENGQIRDLSTSDLDNLGTHAWDINDSAQAVGYARGVYGAKLFENGQMRDLTSLLPQDSGWDYLAEAKGINNTGQIVGDGVINGRGGHAFLLTPPQTSVDSASQSVAAGGTVSTSTGDGTASSSDPVNTTITTPVAGTVSINETSINQPETTGFSFFGQQINIEAPQASVQNPLSLRFVVDSSLMPSGTDHNTMQLFRDGVRIEACDSGSSATTASPDPCVKQRSQLPDGDASITVLSSHASAWNLGVAQAGTPLYSFKGFFQPVDKLPTINSVKAGAAVPVRFSLGGDRGLDIFAAGYPISGRTPIDPSASLDAIEQTVTASSSGLSYSTGTGQYTYTWKTDKGWAGQTRQLVLRLKDGTEHKATFKLTK